MPAPYSVQFLTGIERTITKERLTRYLRATSQDVSKALELYEFNVQLSEVLYGLLHSLEVTVRNAEHHTLTAATVRRPGTTSLRSRPIGKTNSPRQRRNLALPESRARSWLNSRSPSG